MHPDVEERLNNLTFKTRRLIFFGITIAIGLAAGLAFGWLLAPPQAPDNAPLGQLRADFKADAVLMAAERFAAYSDPVAALRQLEGLADDPVSMMVSAMTEAEKIGYSAEDMALMKAMFATIDENAVKEWRGGSDGN